jgi:ferric-dicitrate binding protein FerR (iron transport regulator)
MSEELFERYLRNDLDEAGARELSAILATEEGTRAFTEFVQEWTLLGEAARQRVAEAERPTTRRTRKRIPASKPDRAWIGWTAGLAAAVLFMIALATPTRMPGPTPIAKFEPSAPVPVEPTKPATPDPIPASPPQPPSVPTPPAPPPAPPPKIEPPAPAPEPPKPIEPPRPPEPPRRTEPEKAARPVIAQLRRVAGEVHVVAPGIRRRAAVQEGLSPDDGLEVTGAQSHATVEFPDTSRIDVNPESVLEHLAEKQGRRSFALTRGSISATVAKQTAGRALGMSTPHAEITVVGTQFLVAVTAESTRLEVREGRVRLSREGASVEVTAGHTAIAGKGIKLESKPTVHTREFQAVQDTSISGADPSRAFGSAEVLEVDGDETDGKKIYGLVRWDLSELPATAVIRSAVVTLSIVNESKGTGYSFFEIKRAWNEAEATWTHAASQQSWRVPGLKSTVDRATEPLGTVAPRSKGPLPVLLMPAAEEVLQRWIRRPDSNFGFLIANDANTDGFKFHSREAASPELRPRLTLTYTVAK